MAFPLITLDIAIHADRVADDATRYREAALWVASRFSLASLTASISIVDDATIRELNRDQLGHDWATDVISFVFETLERPDGTHVDGEVIASVDTASRLSVAAGWETRDELLLYVLHGLLHLAGLDDIAAQDQTVMRAAEQAGLIALGVVGADQHLARWDRISY